MIEARGLVRRYGATASVNDLSFTIRPGLVTGFLGPNGAGMTTIMRLILGLDYPSAGSVTVNGRPYARLGAPMHVVGALLDVGPGTTPSCSNGTPGMVCPPKGFTPIRSFSPPSPGRPG
jgi:energy-coupling factor transporter ATP-binding protein EcfA2